MLVCVGKFFFTNFEMKWYILASLCKHLSLLRTALKTSKFVSFESVWFIAFLRTSDMKTLRLVHVEIIF